MAVTKEENKPALTAQYDQNGDVLHIAVGEPRPSEGEHLKNGIVVRYPFDDPGHAWAVTVIGYEANLWHSRTDELALQIAHLLDANSRDIIAVIGRVTGSR